VPPTTSSKFARQSGEGGGMGLTVAMKIIEGHHGSIDIESKSLSGTTVIVKLPYIN
jgi:signal transduction histidine kinase